MEVKKVIMFLTVFLLILSNCKNTKNSTSSSSDNGTPNSSQPSGENPSSDSSNGETPNSSQPPQIGSIDGYIFEKMSWNDFVWSTIYSSPLPDVKVEIENTSFAVYTNENGYFLLKDVSAGTYFLKLSKNGYCTQRWEVVILGNVHRGGIVLSPLPITPSVESVESCGYSGCVKIKGTTSPESMIGGYLSTSPNGPVSCWRGSSSDSSGNFEFSFYNLSSGTTYYYQLVSKKLSYYFFENPQVITNPPYCGNGYAFLQYYCVSERTPLASFVAP